jgi:hypothetical protein
MSFEPKIFNSDEPSGRGDLPERASLGAPLAPLWDDAAQLELPDDLAALAEQLRDDAMHLAACHPADATPEQRAVAWAEVEKGATVPRWRFARVRWWATGVAAALVVIGAGWFSWSVFQSPQGVPADVAVATSPEVGTHEAASATIAPPPLVVASLPHEERNVVTGSDEIKGPRVVRLPEDSPPRVIPAGAFLQDVSGPELDAMLELLAEQTDTGLSI